MKNNGEKLILFVLGRGRWKSDDAGGWGGGGGDRKRGYDGRSGGGGAKRGRFDDRGMQT